MKADRYQSLLDAIEATPPIGKGKPDDRMVQCPNPAHPDLDPSCHYTLAADGTVLMYCQSWGCSFEEMLTGLGGFIPADAFPPGSERRNGYRPSTPKPRAPKPQPLPEPHHWVKAGEWVNRYVASINEPGPIHRRLEARDEQGNPVLDPRKGKTLKRVVWPTGTDVRALALYLSWDLDPDLTKPVIVVEGEKTADALRSLGYQAVALLGWNHQPSDEALALLRGRPIILWPDNDGEGQRAMRDLAGRLRGAVALVGVPAGKRVGWDAADAGADEVVALVEGARPDEPDPMGMAPLSSVRFKAPKPLLLGMADANGEFTCANAHGGAGKGLTACWLAANAQAQGVRLAVLDFEGRPNEWVPRMESLGIDTSGVLYISRDRVPLDIRGLSIIGDDRRLADHVVAEMRKHEVGFYILDNIITALLLGEDRMKSDPLVPWQYREVVEGWGIPGISFAHPPRGRTDGEPFGSSMWSAASRFLWHGTSAATGVTEGEHHTRWRLHKANSKRKPDPFLLVTTFSATGDEMPIDIEYRIDTISTHDWLLSVMGTQEWTVEALADLMLESDDNSTITKVEQAKERIRAALKRGRSDSFIQVDGGRGKAGRWARKVADVTGRSSS